ncbi:HNH endonuclease [Ceratobasidium sp. AG-Ba]|nr:HNH endonuclease [Ceratobasidium sp. AG-Ba]
MDANFAPAGASDITLNQGEDNSDNDNSYVPERLPAPRPTIGRARTPSLNIALRPPPVSEEIRNRLSEVAPDGHRCVLTLSEVIPDCAHVLSRGTKSHMIRRLEYSWGMKPRSLNVDSSRNLMWLDANSHKLFDHRYWALVPTLTTLENIQKFSNDQLIVKKRPKFTQKFPHAEWEYSFVQLKACTAPYIRYDRPLPQFSVHWPPFSTLSPIRSHLHPFFVICNVAQKDETLRPNIESALDAGYETLPPGSDLLTRIRLCRSLFALWRMPLPDGFDQLAPPKQSRSDASSGHSTTSRRSKRKRGTDDQSSTTGMDDDSQGYEPTESAHSESLPTPGESRGTHGELAGYRAQNQVQQVPYWSKVGCWLQEVESSTHVADSNLPQKCS